MQTLEPNTLCLMLFVGLCIIAWQTSYIHSFPPLLLNNNDILMFCFSTTVILYYLQKSLLLCVCVYMYTYVFIYVCMYMYVYMYICVYLYTYINARNPRWGEVATPHFIPLAKFFSPLVVRRC